MARRTTATTKAGKAQPDTPGEKIAADVRDYAAGLSDNEKAMLYPAPSGNLSAEAQRAKAEAGMADMSKKFLDMGAQVYVDQAEVVKESNKAL